MILRRFLSARRTVRHGWSFIIPLLLYGLSAAPRSGSAQELNEQVLEQGSLAPGPAKGDWDVTLGLGVAGVPRYPGARDYRATPVPLALIKYRDLFFLGPGGLGANVVRWQGLRAGPVIGLTGGRSQSDDAHLTGLGNIQPSATVGAFLAYDIGRFEVAGTLRQAVIHTGNGLTGRLEMHYRQPLIAQKLALAFGPELDLADGRYSQTWFGVSPGQAARSGLPAFSPGGGVKDVGANANLTYRWSEHVLLRSFIDIRELVGDIRNSPIVQKKTQILIGAGAAYHF